jgi:uncharacterized protein (TIGR02600 family)
MDQLMKSPRVLTLRAFHRNPGSRRGVALLLVLGCLVLLTALILALVISSQNNLKSSKLYANGSSVKTLADSTVSLVMAQISQATSNGTQVAWASQPGMIRTYDNTGKPLTNYRLFSWDTPTVSGTYTASNDASQLSSTASTPWYNSPALFVDLNQPVADAKGTLHFPIVDGNPSDLVSYTTPAPASTPVLTYTPYTGTFLGQPVTIPQIEGFWVIPPNTAAAAASGNSPAISAGPAVTSKTTVPSNSTNNDIPMPVKWLYVLKDGTVVAPATTSTGTTVTISAATLTNPIVGRIAYWTDDETAKVNINTASEGAFSDTPRTDGASDFAFAAYPTAQNEVQRYPGHPAMTCLSTVLGSLFPVDHTLVPPSTGSYYTAPSPATTYPPYQPYYDLAPKLNVDTGTNLGSKAGTVLTYNGQTGTGTPTALIPKTDRLYATVDEMMFSSNLFTDNAPHTASPTVTGASSTRPLSTSGTFTQAFLEKAKFFLTADSRAPDVNLFNQPRILTWPINVTNDAAHRTPFDQTIAFCGTLNNLPYYFQRSRSDHPTVDLPSTYDNSGLDRNRQLIGYLQALTSTSNPIPGFGGSFLAKYPQAKTSSTNTATPPSDRDQILTEIFDYIRCLNLDDTSTPAMTTPFAPIATGSYTTTGKYVSTTGGGAASSVADRAGFGSVVPIYDTVNNTRGFGRYPTISEISIIFIATGWNDGQDIASSTNSLTINDVNYISPTAGTNPRGYSFSYYKNSGGTAVYNVPWGFYNDGTDTLTQTYNSFVTTAPGEYAPPYFTVPTSTGGVQLPAVAAGTIQVQAALLINFFDPSQGNVVENPTSRIQILGLNNFQWGANSGSTTPLGFPDQSSSTGTVCTSNMYPMDGSNFPMYTMNWGGNLGFRSFLVGQQAGQVPGTSNSYPFISGAKNFPYTADKPAASGGGGQFYFSGGDITINVLIPSNTASYPPTGWPSSLSNPQKTAQPPIQTIKVTFPSATLPLPTMVSPGLNNATSGVTSAFPPLHVYSGTFQDRGYWNDRFQIGNQIFGNNPEFINATDVVRSVRAAPGDVRMVAGQSVVIDTAGAASAGAGYFDSTGTKVLNQGLTAWQYGSSTTNLVHSLRESIDYPFGGAILGQLVPGLSYAGEPAAGTAFGTTYPGGLSTFSGAGNCAGANGALMWNYNGGNPTITTIPGDWDNGMSFTDDGPYINKPDEGDYNFTSNILGLPYYAEINGATTSTFTPGATYFSPNRMMSGPGLFGSLPTGVARNLPWQTLLFCPNPPAGPVHPGFGVGTGTLGPTDVAPYSLPPDHLMLDLFNMPVVEPYPISEPLSTAGRINMNYQIVPFTYIERSTGLRAVLKSERMTVIPDSVASTYKQANATASSNTTGYDFRVPINADQTMYGFDSFFTTTNDIFRSASQVCDMFLYPARDALMSLTAGPLWDPANATITKFWNGNTAGGAYNTSTTTPSNTAWPTHYLTGDNSREKPYADIYPRLTTKSNTFTIHYYVQTLQKIVNSDPTLWNDAMDKVTGEYRGSTTVERYVNPNDTTLPDFAAQAIAGTPQALDSFYKFRVVNERQFAP